MLKPVPAHEPTEISPPVIDENEDALRDDEILSSELFKALKN